MRKITTSIAYITATAITFARVLAFVANYHSIKRQSIRVVDSIVEIINDYVASYQENQRINNEIQLKKDKVKQKAEEKARLQQRLISDCLGLMNRRAKYDFEYKSGSARVVDYGEGYSLRVSVQARYKNAFGVWPKYSDSSCRFDDNYKIVSAYIGNADLL